MSGTPRGMVAKEAGKVKPVMDAVHGSALAIAALLVAIARFCCLSSITDLYMRLLCFKIVDMLKANQERQVCIRTNTLDSELVCKFHDHISLEHMLMISA